MNIYCTYTINDKVVGLLFALPAIGKIQELEVDFPKDPDIALPFHVANKLFCGYWCNQKADLTPDDKIELTFKDFLVHIDDELDDRKLSDQTNHALKTYAESKTVKRLIKALTPTPNKDEEVESEKKI